MNDEEWLGGGTCLGLGKNVVLGVSDERLEKELVPNVNWRNHWGWRHRRSDLWTSAEPSHAPRREPTKDPTRLRRVILVVLSIGGLHFCATRDSAASHCNLTRSSRERRCRWGRRGSRASRRHRLVEGWQSVKVLVNGCRGEEQGRAGHIGALRGGRVAADAELRGSTTQINQKKPFHPFRNQPALHFLTNSVIS